MQLLRVRTIWNPSDTRGPVSCLATPYLPKYASEFFTFFTAVSNLIIFLLTKYLQNYSYQHIQDRWIIFVISHWIIHQSTTVPFTSEIVDGDREDGVIHHP